LFARSDGVPSKTRILLFPRSAGSERSLGPCKRVRLDWRCENSARDQTLAGAWRWMYAIWLSGVSSQLRKDTENLYQISKRFSKPAIPPSIDSGSSLSLCRPRPALTRQDGSNPSNFNSFGIREKHRVVNGRFFRLPRFHLAAPLVPRNKRSAQDFPGNMKLAHV